MQKKRPNDGSPIISQGRGEVSTFLASRGSYRIGGGGGGGGGGEKGGGDWGNSGGGGGGGGGGIRKGGVDRSLCRLGKESLGVKRDREGRGKRSRNTAFRLRAQHAFLSNSEKNKIISGVGVTEKQMLEIGGVMEGRNEGCR